MKGEDKRRHYFIDKSFQTKFILKFCTIVILTSILIGSILFLLSRNSTTVAIENTEVTVKNTSDFILPFILQTLILVTIFSGISVILLTIFVSHKIAGPLYRLKNEIEKLGQGNLRVNFHIRTSDQLKSLADSLSRMVESLRGRIVFFKKEFSEIKSFLNNITSEDKQFLEDKLKKIEDIFNYFKI